MPLVCPSHIDYPHRTNADGTIDSICVRCHITIGRSTWEAELERMEASHVCDSRGRDLHGRKLR